MSDDVQDIELSEEQENSLDKMGYTYYWNGTGVSTMWQIVTWDDVKEKDTPKKAFKRAMSDIF